MKKSLLLLLLFVSIIVHSQGKVFRFAFLSDTHIGSPDGKAEEDLRRTVADINAMTDIAFVVITGDITELGTNEELRRAKEIFDGLKVPYHIIPGNHDTGWSESGGLSFSTIFGNDKFSFEHNGIRFLGCASGPYVRMSDGHVPRGAINWLDAELRSLKPGQLLIFLNHYPIDNGLDNWYEITDRLRKHNTLAVLCGHGHANRAMDFEDIPAVMGRSNLRAKASVGGYNLVDVRSDSIIFTERRPGVETLPSWTGIKVDKRNFNHQGNFPRPDFSINEKYNQATRGWTFSSTANIISTPAVLDGRVIVGNQDGVVACLSLQTGKRIWEYKTGGPVYSSPAIAANSVILGSADGHIYSLSKQGKLNWKKAASASVLGSPIVKGDTVYIGASDHHFYALDAKSGKTIWSFDGMQGPVVSTPVLVNDRIIFGAWDRHLYALDQSSGKLLWKWNNGSTVRNFSPASCIPVVHNSVVYVVAPDRNISAIDINDGSTLWRNNDSRVRESIGISEDGKWIYGKTMQDTLVAYATSREKQDAAWRMHCGFGYEHVPSMLIEKDGHLFFGTKNGVVYAIDPAKQEIAWAHKIDNSMVNTVSVLDKRRLIVSTMDGKVALIEVK